MSKEIKRYFLNNKYGNQILFSVPSDVSFAQIDDMRILLDTSYTDDVENINFSLWALDINGNIIAKFYPDNYIIDNKGTQTFICFDTYIQLPVGSSVIANISKNDTSKGSISIASTIELFY